MVGGLLLRSIVNQLLSTRLVQVRGTIVYQLPNYTEFQTQPILHVDGPIRLSVALQFVFEDLLCSVARYRPRKKYEAVGLNREGFKCEQNSRLEPNRTLRTCPK